MSVRDNVTMKPSGPEEEYFARQELELRRKIAQERQSSMEQQERQQLRDLHYMKCPKCGLPLEEIAFGDVRVDKCFHCEGMWFDKGEIETVHGKEPGFIGRLLHAFRS